LTRGRKGENNTSTSRRDSLMVAVWWSTKGGESDNDTPTSHCSVTRWWPWWLMRDGEEEDSPTSHKDSLVVVAVDKGQGVREQHTNESS
jgi:hypothetical protein